MEPKPANVLQTLQERGFVEQATESGLEAELEKGSLTCYIGFDPTAKSLHVGSLLPIMSLVHMQRAGHRPIVVVGGGTAMVGDPSGKTEIRPIMSREEIDGNAEALKKQLSRFLDFGEGKALMVNNADWLRELRYVDFLRDIGRHFSVNRMLAAESYKMRLETGLSFIEFNYMLLQAYDFWHLFKQHDCSLQMGGNDQWGNILAGADLIRRLEGETAHGVTFPLLTTSAGVKMGKTHKGAVWLDSGMTSAYDYYQYWINQDDRDVGRFLSLFTHLPLEDVRRLASLAGSDLREAKEVLAYEATTICHGREMAEKARVTSRQLFGKNAQESLNSGPSFAIPLDELVSGIPAYVLFEKAGLCKTRGEARRLISQGGGYLNGERVERFDQCVDQTFLDNNTLLIRAGKKRYMKVVPS